MNTEIDTNRFREAMTHKGVDQTELARRLGCTPGAINQIASGRTRKSRLLPEIASELQVSIDWLLRKTDDPTPGATEHLLTSEEMGWVEMLRRLLPAERSALLLITQSMGSGKTTAPIKPKPDTLHDDRQYYRAEA